MGKKTICLITNWYPTKGNPYVGVFFKEQAFAVSEYFDFIVVHYKEKRRNFMISYLLRKMFSKDYEIKEINREQNTIEYDLNVWYPGYMLVIDFLTKIYRRLTHKENKAGIGTYISSYHKNLKRNALTKIFKKHFQNKVDYFYCIDAQSESSTVQFAAEALEVPYVVSEHAPFPWPGGVINDMEHEAVEKADTFIAISHDVLRHVMLQNIRLRKFVYLGNMINVSQFSLGTEVHTVKTLLIVAAHSFYKNYDLFINIMNRLTEITSEPFKVMIVGYGANKGYSIGVSEFEQQIKNSKFYDRVIMIPEVAHSEIQNIYHQADALVVTSISETFMMTAVEAACCGLPVFSTKCGGVEDYVDNDIGRIFNIMDTEAFAKGLKEFLEGKIVFDANVIRNKVVAKYGKEVFVEKFRKIFERIDS